MSIIDQLEIERKKDKIERVSWRITYYFLFFILIMLNEGVVYQCIEYILFVGIGLLFYLISLAQLKIEFDKFIRSKHDLIQHR